MLVSALLGEDPPRLPVSQLVVIAEQFSISSNAARVALSRMVARGEAIADGEGTYELGTPLRSRARRQLSARRFVPEPSSGALLEVCMRAERATSASVRTQRRDELRRARFAELREGVWLRPDNLPAPDFAHRDEDCEVLEVRHLDPVRLVASVFDLAGWQRLAEELLGLLEARDERSRSIAERFELDARVLRHIVRDPMLPSQFEPAGWSGALLRERYEQHNARLREDLARLDRRGN